MLPIEQTTHLAITTVVETKAGRPQPSKLDDLLAMIPEPLRPIAQLMTLDFNDRTIGQILGQRQKFVANQILAIKSALAVHTLEAFFSKLGIAHPTEPFGQRLRMATEIFGISIPESVAKDANILSIEQILEKLNAAQPPHLADLKAIALAIAEGTTTARIPSVTRLGFDEAGQRRQELYAALGVVDHSEFMTLLGKGPKKKKDSIQPTPAHDEGPARGAPPPPSQKSALTPEKIIVIYVNMNRSEQLVMRTLQIKCREKSIARALNIAQGALSIEINPVLAKLGVADIAEAALMLRGIAFPKGGVSAAFHANSSGAPMSAELKPEMAQPPAAPKPIVAPQPARTPTAIAMAAATSEPELTLAELEARIIAAASNPACDNYNFLMDAVDPDGKLTFSRFQEVISDICVSKSIQPAPARRGEAPSYFGGLIHNLQGTTPPPVPPPAPPQPGVKKEQHLGIDVNRIWGLH